MKKSLNLLFVFFLCFQTNAQVWFDLVGNTLEVPITAETSKEHIKTFLDYLNAKDIEFNPNPRSKFPIRLKNNQGNWMLLDAYKSQGNLGSTEMSENFLNDIIFNHQKTKTYSFQFPNETEESLGITWATNKNIGIGALIAIVNS